MSFAQGVPSVNTLINSSNTQVFGNTSTGTALSVQQLGTGSVMNVATSTGTSALFVTSAGNVGVGTAGPSALLHVNGGDILAGSNINGSAGNTTWRLQPQYNGSAPFNGYFRIANAWDPIAGTGQANYAGVGINLNSYQGGSQLEFYTSSTNNAVPTERMRITSGGNVGINTTSPGTALQVNGDQISVPSYVSSPGSPYTTGQQFYFAFNGNLTDSQSGVTTTTYGNAGGYVENAAIRFNGSFYFTFPNSLVTSTVSQTVAFWFCPLQTSSQTVFSFANGSQTVSMNMDLNATQNKFNIYIATPTSWVVSALGSNAPPYKLGTWIHVAVVTSTTSATLYFNGVQVDQQTGSYTSASSSLMTTVYVGVNGDGSQGRRFNGFLDELRIYNVALSPTQVLGLYTSTTFAVNGMSGGSVLTNSVGIGVTSPVNSLDTSGAVAIGSYAGTNQAPAGGAIISGNVGIGTASPSYTLDCYTGTVQANQVRSPAGNYLTLVNGAGGSQIVLQGTTTAITGGAVYMTGGGVGIGTTNPGPMLDIWATGSTFQTNGSLRFYRSDVGSWWKFVGPDTGNTLYLQPTNTSYGVYITATATSWSSASDARLKNIIEPISNALAKVDLLNPVLYSWKTDETNKPHPGLIAQDVLKVQPECVSTNSEGMYGVQYTELIPLAFQAIKELSAENTALKQSLSSLEARLAVLESK